MDVETAIKMIMESTGLSKQEIVKDPNKNK